MPKGFVKVATLGCLGVLLAPAAGVAYAIGTMSIRAGKFAAQNPRLTLAGLAATGVLWYNSAEPVQQHLQEYLKKGEGMYRQYTQRRAVEDARQIQQSVLEEQLRRTAQYNAQLEQQLSMQQQQAVKLQQELAAKQGQEEVIKQLQAYVSQSVQQQSAQRSAESIAYYTFADVDDTLSSIGKRVCGWDCSAELAKENGITDPRALLAGQALRVSPALVRNLQYVHTTVPKSIKLPGSTTITEACQGDTRCTQSVLQLNHELGIRYKDAFPYKQGARIVYHN